MGEPPKDYKVFIQEASLGRFRQSRPPGPFVFLVLEWVCVRKSSSERVSFLPTDLAIALVHREAMLKEKTEKAAAEARRKKATTVRETWAVLFLEEAQTSGGFSNHLPLCKAL